MAVFIGDHAAGLADVHQRVAGAFRRRHVVGKELHLHNAAAANVLFAGLLGKKAAVRADLDRGDAAGLVEVGIFQILV